MLVSSASLLDRLSIAIDQDADPVDLDDALAEFLLAVVRKRRLSKSISTLAESPAPAVVR